MRAEDPVPGDQEENRAKGQKPHVCGFEDHHPDEPEDRWDRLGDHSQGGSLHLQEQNHVRLLCHLQRQKRVHFGVCRYHQQRIHPGFQLLQDRLQEQGHHSYRRLRADFGKLGQKIRPSQQKGTGTHHDIQRRTQHQADRETGQGRVGSPEQCDQENRPEDRQRELQP